MTTLPHGNYRLAVRDFGPVASADLEIRPLTVFVGASNTGKSYLATLIYALHRTFRDRVARTIGQRGWTLHFDSMPGAVSEPTVEDFCKWIRTQENGPPSPLPHGVVSAIRASLERGDGPVGRFADRLTHYYGRVRAGDLARQGAADGATVQFDRDAGDRRAVQYRFLFRENGTNVSGCVSDSLVSGSRAVTDLMRRPFPVDPFERPPNTEGSDLLEWLAARIMEESIEPLMRKAHYLPADRAGAMTAYPAIVTGLLQNAADPVGRRPSDPPLLPIVAADFLSDLHFAQVDPTDSPELPGLAKSIEDDILSGRITLLRNDVRAPRIIYRPREWTTDLPVAQSSSMVAEIAPVVLYLRHIVRTGDTLIVEEPEAHLHPAMQAEFTRALARVVKAGVRVLLTTHSEWVMETLGNLVSASHLLESERVGIAGGDAALTQAEVGVWLFGQTDTAGSAVRQIELDPEVGLYPAGYDEIADSLYNNSVLIGNELRRRSSS